DLQSALATLGPKWGMQKLVDIDDKQARDDLARLSSATLTIVAQAARGKQTPVPESEVEQGENAAAKFLIRWRGEADPRAVKALDTYWISAAELGSDRVEVAAALEEAALKVLREKSPDRQLETNVEYWAAVVLDIAQIPADLTPAMFGCARVAGWSAHILEQKRTGRLIRPGARYIGPAPRSVDEL